VAGKEKSGEKRWKSGDSILNAVMWPRLSILVLALPALALIACQGPSRIEEGMASFYADSFEGRQTANGEPYRKNALTAAHRTLAFGTRVKVTDLGNGRSVWVRINDRGPFVEGRIIDLSHGAARKLRLVEKGTARVRLEIYE
jgi:rare lipoprotein A